MAWDLHVFRFSPAASKMLLVLLVLTTNFLVGLDLVARAVVVVPLASGRGAFDVAAFDVAVADYPISLLEIVAFSTLLAPLYTPAYLRIEVTPSVNVLHRSVISFLHAFISLVV